MYLTFSSSQTVDCRPLGDMQKPTGGLGGWRMEKDENKEKKKERQAERKKEKGKKLFVTDILYQYCNKNTQE